MIGLDETDKRLKAIRDKLIEDYKIKLIETWEYSGKGGGSKVAPIRRKSKPKKYQV